MTEKQLNLNYIKGRLKDFNLSNELAEQIRLLVSESFIDGLRQKEFDIDMDLQQENTNLKMQIDEVKEYIKTLSTKEDLTNAGLTKEFADGCIFGYECIKDDVGFILSKLKEVKK